MYRDPNLEFSGIVFVKERHVALMLKALLKQIQQLDRSNYGFLKVDFVVGFSGRKLETDEQMSLHKKQEEVLYIFRSFIFYIFIEGA